MRLVVHEPQAPGGGQRPKAERVPSLGTNEKGKRPLLGAEAKKKRTSGTRCRGRCPEGDPEEKPAAWRRAPSG